MLKKIGKIVLAVFLIFLCIASVIYASTHKKDNDEAGTISIIVNNINNEVVSSKRVSFTSNDNLYDLLANEYTITSDNSQFGHYITGIRNEEFNISTNGLDSFIWLELYYLNDGIEYSSDISFDDYHEINITTGIDNISLVDNMILGINERDNTHITSINKDNVHINNNIEKTNKIFKNIFMISSIIFFLLLLTCIICIIKKDKSKMTVRKIAILSVMTVLLFVQEELLSFIPNFQLTFLLIAIYVSVFGLKDSLLIILVHVILDNLIMGSLTPIVFIPMILGYIGYAILINIVKNRHIIFIIINACIGVIFYALMFLITNSIFLDINIKLYIIADIPFDIILIITTITTIYLLYNPLKKVLLELWEKSHNM